MLEGQTIQLEDGTTAIVQNVMPEAKSRSPEIKQLGPLIHSEVSLLVVLHRLTGSKCVMLSSMTRKIALLGQH